MSDLPEPRHGLMGQLMLRTLGKDELSLPFDREIFLINVHIAGTGHYDASRVVARLEQSQRLMLQRQPDNPHDQLAIEIRTPDGVKLGYVPRKHNPVLARLMDAGKILTATLASCEKEPHGAWVDMRVDIALQDF